MSEVVQPEINIGMVGHVDHGKTTLVEALSGVWTDRHSEEIRRGISLRIGYADCDIRMCPNCKPPEAYTTKKICSHCGSKTKLLRRISFVDSPGHEILMATMLSGAAIMDGACLVIAANEPCPQPQTREHTAALEIIGVKNLVVVQNKIELVSKEKVIENYRQIKEFLKGTIYSEAPIIPISAMQRVNIDILIEAFEKFLPTPKRDPTKPPLMFIARSFDVNKPGATPEELVGGVVGGSLLQGKLRVGDEIEIRPGLRVEGKKEIYEPLTSTIDSLMAGGAKMNEVGPGGLIAVATLLDPSLTKADRLIGNVLGLPGKLPPLFNELEVEVHLMKRVVGSVDQLEVSSIETREKLMVNVGTSTTLMDVVKVKGEFIEAKLRKPVCANEGQRIAISRNIGGRWRLIGWGRIVGGR